MDQMRRNGIIGESDSARFGALCSTSVVSGQEMSRGSLFLGGGHDGTMQIPRRQD